MNNYTVSTIDRELHEVSAEYYQIEDGWVTFKDTDHKAVFSVRESAATVISREQKRDRDVTVVVNSLINPYVAGMDEAARRAAQA